MQPSVLVVDDDREMREVLVDGLAARGFAVTSAGTVAEAYQLFSSAHPDVVLADFELGDGTALDLLAQLKASDSNIPVVVLTG
ncbi:MAG: response regulator, partial [Terriglobales bacterium]